MPRGQGPKKDAESGETWTGSCRQAMSRRIPNGATRERGSVAPPAECYRREEGTGGTETSQYPEEEKSNEIPGVVASETGGAQTVAGFARGGVVGPRSFNRSKRTVVGRSRWKARTAEGESPVGDGRSGLGSDPEYHGTREILWEAGGTTLQG